VYGNPLHIVLTLVTPFATCTFETNYKYENMEEENPNRQAVRNLLKTQTELKCTLDDGRIVTGGLVCIDRLYVQRFYFLSCLQSQNMDRHSYSYLLLFSCVGRTSFYLT
jgi:hypothetical protein